MGGKCGKKDQAMRWWRRGRGGVRFGGVEMMFSTKEAPNNVKHLVRFGGEKLLGSVCGDGGKGGSGCEHLC